MESWVTVTPMGELDVVTSPAFKKEINHLIAVGHRHLRVDLRRTRYLDTTGLGVLLGTLNKVSTASGRVVILLRPQQRLKKVFQTTGLDRIFQFDDGEPGDGPDAPVPASPLPPTRGASGTEPIPDRLNFIAD
jgi:anti-sigma B factor antagonist